MSLHCCTVQVFAMPRAMVVPGGWIKIFGSGTKLIVTDTAQLARPTVIAFPPSNPQDGKRTLLCIAKGMFPDVVNFKWKEEDKEVSVAEKRIMEQKIDDGRASMLIIDETTVEKSRSCIVVHEENTEVIVTDSKEGGSLPDKRETCKKGFELSRSLYLSSLTYTFMILKSAAYFGFVPHFVQEVQKVKACFPTSIIYC